MKKMKLNLMKTKKKKHALHYSLFSLKLCNTKIKMKVKTELKDLSDEAGIYQRNVIKKKRRLK